MIAIKPKPLARIQEKITIISVLKVVDKVPRGTGRTDIWRHTHTTFGRTNKCAHCPNMAPMFMVNCFIEGALVDGSFGKMMKKNFYKTIMLCSTCRVKFIAQAERSQHVQPKNPAPKVLAQGKPQA